MERMRVTAKDGSKTQWVDSEVYMVIDALTGEPVRLFEGGRAMTVDLNEALNECGKQGYKERNVIVKLPSIIAIKL